MPGQFLDVHNRLAHFDGTKLHFTEKFSGERYVIIYYCNNRVDFAPPSVICFLTQLGFNLPGEAFDISRVENSNVESALVDSVSSATSSSASAAVPPGQGLERQDSAAGSVPQAGPRRRLRKRCRDLDMSHFEISSVESALVDSVSSSTSRSADATVPMDFGLQRQDSVLVSVPQAVPWRHLRKPCRNLGETGPSHWVSTTTELLAP